MFRCHMLVTKDLRPIPKGVKVLDNWGDLTVVTDAKQEKIKGKHMFIEAADPNAFEAWVGGLEVWMGTGHPSFQRFELTPFDAPD